jgi:uncharacterized phage protein (TIGR01671 family)
VREILFRGKRIDNGEWVEGYYFCSRNPHRENIHKIHPLDSDWSYEISPSTVGQYTGLTDKNGKKIFEGDILEVHDKLPFFDGYNSEEICYNGKVMYIDDQGMYVCEGNEDGNTLCALNLDECEIIGNIHDNPELLEVRE